MNLVKLSRSGQSSKEIKTMNIHPELHRWAQHPANVACRALADSRYVRYVKLLLDETGCGDSGAFIRFRSDQDPDETPLNGCEIILFDQEYVVPLFDLYAALYLDSVARKERSVCEGLDRLIPRIRDKMLASEL